MTNNELEIIDNALIIVSTIPQEEIEIQMTGKSIREMSGLVTIKELPFGFRAWIGFNNSNDESSIRYMLNNLDINNPNRSSFWPHKPYRPLELAPDKEEDYVRFFADDWNDRLKRSFLLAINVACIRKERSLIKS